MTTAYRVVFTIVMEVEGTTIENAQELAINALCEIKMPPYCEIVDTELIEATAKETKEQLQDRLAELKAELTELEADDKLEAKQRVAEEEDALEDHPDAEEN